MPLYEALFPKGLRVRIADRATLDVFALEWKFHHKLTTEQLHHAGAVANVASIGYYHGGDVLYELVGVPGTWHERCLRAVDGSPSQ